MVKQRAFLLFLIALLLGGGAAWLANRWIQNSMLPASSADANNTPVVVAALDIPFGQKIEAVHVKTISWPSDTAPAGVFNKMSDAEGKITNQKILAGEILLKERVVEHAGGSTLSAIISPNMRAITVRVNDVIGVAGFLLPGNRVDVLASRMDNQRAYIETILEDLKVLAVDQTASPDKDKPLVVRAVTLEMDPKQAERLVQATEEGTVQLALRNPIDQSLMVKAQPVEVPKAAVVEPVVEVKPVVKPRPRKPVANVEAITIIRGTSVDVDKVKL